MKRQILVCLDGSELAEQVLPLAAQFARGTASDLVLLQVVPTPAIVQRMIWPTDLLVVPPVTTEALADEALAYLRPLAEHWTAPDLAVTCDVVAGEPAQEIVTYSVAHEAITMVALATHGRGGLGRWLFGSIATKLLQISVRPLLLWRVAHEPLPLPEHGPRTIMVPLDGSVCAAQALPQAEELARAFGASLLLVSVVPSITEISRAGMASLWLLEKYEHQADQTQAELARQAHELRVHGIPTRTQVLRGSPSEEILCLAEEEPIDLIIMSTHGRGDWERFWLGSVALQVLQRVRQPVVLIHAAPLAEQRGAKVEQETPVPGMLLAGAT